MKKLLIIFLFVSSSCFAQDNLGISKQALTDALKKAKVEYKEIASSKEQKDSSLIYSDQGVQIENYFVCGNIEYIRKTLPLETLNETIQYFTSQNYKKEAKFTWINFEDKRFHYVVYEVQRSKSVPDKFYLIISK